MAYGERDRYCVECHRWLPPKMFKTKRGYKRICKDCFVKAMSDMQTKVQMVKHQTGDITPCRGYRRPTNGNV
jgi:recombinational DNA repair protein (RecF pathway)